MNGSPDTDREYFDLAYDLLKSWVLSDDEPEGSLWDLYCDLCGVDAEKFAEAVVYQRERMKRKAA